MGLLFLANRNYSNLSHPSPLVIPTNGRSAVRPPTLANPSSEATRMNHNPFVTLPSLSPCLII